MVPDHISQSFRTTLSRPSLEPQPGQILNAGIVRRPRESYAGETVERQITCQSVSQSGRQAGRHSFLLTGADPMTMAYGGDKSKGREEGK